MARRGPGGQPGRARLAVPVGRTERRGRGGGCPGSRRSAGAAVHGLRCRHQQRRESLHRACTAVQPQPAQRAVQHAGPATGHRGRVPARGVTARQPRACGRDPRRGRRLRPALGRRPGHAGRRDRRALAPEPVQPAGTVHQRRHRRRPPRGERVRRRPRRAQRAQRQHPDSPHRGDLGDPTAIARTDLAIGLRWRDPTLERPRCAVQRPRSETGP